MTDAATEYEVALATAAAPEVELSPFDLLVQFVQEKAGCTLTESECEELERLSDSSNTRAICDYLGLVLRCANPSFRVGSLCRAVGLDSEPLRDSALQAGISHTLLAQQTAAIQKQIDLQPRPFVEARMIPAREKNE